jgi:hypothetical protein
MLGLPPSVRIYFATDVVDMRNGIDGLRGIVEGVLKRDPFEGHLRTGRTGPLFKGRRRSGPGKTAPLLQW